MEDCGGGQGLTKGCGAKEGGGGGGGGGGGRRRRRRRLRFLTMQECKSDAETPVIELPYVNAKHKHF
jgi:hypothetical protein